MRSLAAERLLPGVRAYITLEEMGENYTQIYEGGARAREGGGYEMRRT